MKGARMTYERVKNALALVAKEDTTMAWLLECTLIFTSDMLHDKAVDDNFRKEFGERIYRVISDIIDHM